MLQPSMRRYILYSMFMLPIELHLHSQDLARVKRLVLGGRVRVLWCKVRVRVWVGVRG